MPGILLDTNALYWLVSRPDQLAEEALVEIGESQESGSLFVSPITAWELAIATKKPAHKDPPDLGELTPAQWFREAVRATGARVIPIKQRIAVEAADVVSATGHKDPGDCYLIATARVRRLSLVTRDATIRQIADGTPGYLSVVVC